MGSAREQSEHWSIDPHGWADRFEPNQMGLWHQMLTTGLVFPRTRFFDAGCGSGGASVLAADRGAQITGLDATEALLKIARERLPQADFRQGDLEQLPFADGSFDCVFACNSIQFTESPSRALAELGRVAANEATIVVCVLVKPAESGLRQVQQTMNQAAAQPPPRFGPFSLAEPGKLEAALAEAGLWIERDEEIPCDFVFSGIEEAWLAARAAGPTRLAIQQLGELRSREVGLKAMQPYITTRGCVRLPNRMRVVGLARRPA
jgi:ubiquinone/menaquinone biosynthesis C-methylase UbiE